MISSPLRFVTPTAWVRTTSHYVLLATSHYVLLATSHYVLLATAHTILPLPLRSTYSSPLTTYNLRLATYNLLPTIHYVLPTTYYRRERLRTTCYLLLTTGQNYFTLLVTYYLLQARTTSRYLLNLLLTAGENYFGLLVELTTYCRRELLCAPLGFPPLELLPSPHA